MTDINEFAARYVAVWNEGDPDRRRAAIAALWSEDGTEVIESATYRGHRALESRISDAHDQFVAQGGFVFRNAGDTVGHHDTVRFTTYMEPASGGEIAWVGFVFIKLGTDGRIDCDYQFANPPPPGVTTGAPPGTTAVVEEFLRLASEGEPDRIAELYADDIAWKLSWPSEDYSNTVPWIQHRSNRAGVAEHFRLVAEHHVARESSTVVTSVLVDGTEAVILGEFHNLAKPTQRRYQALFALHLTVENGLITRHHVYEDSLAVAQAFGQGLTE